MTGILSDIARRVSESAHAALEGYVRSACILEIPELWVEHPIGGSEYARLWSGDDPVARVRIVFSGEKIRVQGQWVYS